MTKRIIRKKTVEEKPKAKRHITRKVKADTPAKPKVLPQDMLRVITELNGIKENKKLLEKREEKLKAELAQHLESNGYKDTKGSFLVKVNVDGKEKVAKKEARKSIKLNAEKAEELFRELKIWDEVIDMKEVINEGYVEQALLNEKITMEQLESITDIKTTYAIIVKDYKPDEEEGLI